MMREEVILQHLKKQYVGKKVFQGSGVKLIVDIRLERTGEESWYCFILRHTADEYDESIMWMTSLRSQIEKRYNVKFDWYYENDKHWSQMK
jgi:hypothetical protein